MTLPTSTHQEPRTVSLLRPAFVPVSAEPVADHPSSAYRSRQPGGGSVVVVRQRPRWDGQVATDQAAEVEVPAPAEPAPASACSCPPVEELAAAVAASMAPALAAISDQIACLLLEIEAMRTRWDAEFPSNVDPEALAD